MKSICLALVLGCLACAAAQVSLRQVVKRERLPWMVSVYAIGTDVQPGPGTMALLIAWNNIQKLVFAKTMHVSAPCRRRRNLRRCWEQGSL
jgi:hypothetical protein